MKPPWLIIAEKELGQKEDKEGENPHIIEYHSSTYLSADKDEVPWCSSFVNWCIEQAGIKGTRSAAAKSWLDWGQALLIPAIGCVCIIKRKKKGTDKATGSSSGYHVAFWLTEQDGKVHLLGGNQSDSVKMSSFNLESYDILGYRMPIGWEAKGEEG